MEQTVFYANKRDRLKAANLVFQDIVDRSVRIQSTTQHYLNSMQEEQTYHTETIVKRRRPLEEYGVICRETRLSLFLEEERLSRSVIDLVLEWKRNKSKE